MRPTSSAWLVLFGVFLSTVVDAQSLEIVYRFTSADPPSRTPLVRAADGSYYGATTAYSAAVRGTIFRVTPAGLATIHAFSGPDGARPIVMVPSSDGNVYGITAGIYAQNWGGPVICGSVFKIAADQRVTILKKFDGDVVANGACFPNRLILASDGNLYGTTMDAYDRPMLDTVFRITPGGIYTPLVQLSHWEPRDLIQGSDGNLYGVTGQGGTGACPFGC
jgi:hypothetical protein